MTQPRPNKQKFFAQRIDWDTSERDSMERKLRFLKVISIAEGAVIVALIAAVVPLITMHEFVPISVIQDKFSGDYEVRVGKEKINVEDKKNEQRMVADVARHVRAREGFTRGEAEQNFRTVFNQLPEEQRPEWRQQYVESPQSMIKRLAVRDQIKIVNPSITWLPSNDSMPNHRIAQFRFDKEKYLAGRVPTRQSFIATLTFTYDNRYVPEQIDDLATNPFGFVVANYRVDPTGPEREISQQAERAGQ